MNGRNLKPAAEIDPGRSAAPSRAAQPGEWPIGDVTWARVGQLRWWIRRAPVPGGLTELLADPDRFLQDPGRLLAHSDLITLGVVPSVTPGAVPLLLRRLNYGRPRHRLRDIFRPTRAERAFKHGLGLERAGVRTPRVLAAGVERCLRWPVRAYLITEFVPDAVTLADYLARHRGLPRELADRLADLLARLHSQGFSHRDLKASNILFDRDQQPYLIDLDGVRYYGAPDDQEALANLARLAREFVVYRSELGWKAGRFLHRYCQQRQRTHDFRQWAGKLASGLPPGRAT